MIIAYTGGDRTPFWVSLWRLSLAEMDILCHIGNISIYSYFMEFVECFSNYETII